MEHSGLKLAGVANAWQLGGYAAADGRRVKANVLLRSGKLCNASPQDLECLREEYGLSTIVDLRSPEERAAEPDPEIAGVRYVPIPVLDGAASPQRVVAQIYRSSRGDPGRFYYELVRAGVLCDDLYTSFFESDVSMRAFRSFFDVLLAQGGGAVLWHCTGGKDRTGLAAVMLLSILGVEQETVLQDFARINRINRTAIDSICAEVGKHARDAREVEQAAALAGVSVPHMRRVFDLAQAQRGSMAAFLQERLRLSGDEIAALRRMYLD